MKIHPKVEEAAVTLALIFILAAATMWARHAEAVPTAPLHTNPAAPANVAQAALAPEPTETLLWSLRENSRKQAAEAAFALSVSAMEREDVMAAQELIQEAVILQPSNSAYLHAAASIAYAQGKYAAAEAHQSRCLELAMAALGPSDIRIAMLMDELGNIYLARQDYQQAEHIWKESLAIYEQALGSTHPSIAPHLNDLATLSMRAGQFDETERLLLQVMHILEADTEKVGTEVAIARHNLADFYIEKNRPVEAKALYLKALDTWKAASGQERIQVATSLNELGNKYLAQRRLAGARWQFVLAIKLLEEEHAQDHPQIREARAALESLESDWQRLEDQDEFSQLFFNELRSQLSQHKQAM